MITITADRIRETAARLCVEANLSLRPDVRSALREVLRRETNPRARRILDAILDNAECARRDNRAICQDTGMPVVFVEIGGGVRVNGDITQAVNKGIEEGYRRGFLRASIVKDPLGRGVSGYAPCVMHVDIVRGNSLRITVLPKGFGCENKSQLKMFVPTAPWESVRDFIVSTVKAAGPDACPPYVVGVGIGGTADYASLLAKKSLLRKISPSRRRRGTVHRAPVRCLENDVLNKINALNIGPMGLGGKTTALAVHIETYPTHIAGLPVAVNISCHALRSAGAVL